MSNDINTNEEIPIQKRRSPIRKNPLDTMKEKEAEKEQVPQQDKPNIFIPTDHVPVTLGSNGILGYPKVLSYRDYTLDEVLELNSLDDDLQMVSIVKVLNKLNLEEGVDHADIHPSDILQILLAIHGSFISNVLEKNYYIDPDLPEGDEEGQLDNKLNIGIADIPVASIKVRVLGTDIEGKPFPKNIKNPFSVQDEVTGDVIKFRYLKASDIIRASVKTKEKFYDEERSYGGFKRDLEKLQSISNDKKREDAIEKFLENNFDTWKEYQIFLQKKSIEEARIITLSKICGVNDIEFDDSDEDFKKKEELKISASIWDFIDEEVFSKYDFGPIDEVSFYSEKLQKTITRRFSFRYDQLLPTDYSKATGRYSLSFD